MAERRSLMEGLKQTPPTIDPHVEKDFVFQQKNQAAEAASSPTTSARVPTSSPGISRTPISTRVRTDFHDALKRASLERQLNKIEPNTLQDILEEAIEPWLKSNNYI